MCIIIPDVAELHVRIYTYGYIHTYACHCICTGAGLSGTANEPLTKEQLMRT